MEITIQGITDNTTKTAESSVEDQYSRPIDIDNRWRGSVVFRIKPVQNNDKHLQGMIRKIIKMLRAYKIDQINLTRRWP